MLLWNWKEMSFSNSQKLWNSELNSFKSFLRHSYYQGSLQQGQSATATICKLKWKNKDEEEASLPAPICNEEIMVIMVSLASNKARRTDGYTLEFYEAAWQVVGDSVEKAIRYVFSPGNLMKQVNSTVLTLFPKNVNSDQMGFQPIFCCGTLYRCIS